MQPFFTKKTLGKMSVTSPSEKILIFFGESHQLRFGFHNIDFRYKCTYGALKITSFGVRRTKNAVDVRKQRIVEYEVAMVSRGTRQVS